MRQTAIKYSKIRTKLKIGDKNSKFNSDYANFTHFLQNKENGTAHHFKPYVIEFLERFDVVEDGDNFQYELPIEWDVPFPPVKNPKFKFIDLFAGIGGFRLAFQNLGGKCVFSSEWNSFSQKTYEANFGEVPFGDITKIDESNIPNHDVLLAGFPCQPFSIAA